MKRRRTRTEPSRVTQRDPGLRDAEDTVDRRLEEMMVDIVDLGQRNQRNIRRLTVNLIFIILLSIGLAYAIREAHNSATKNLCRQVNIANSGQIRLWQGALAIPPTPLKPTATPEERAAYDQQLKTRAEFVANLHRYFDPVKC